MDYPTINQIIADQILQLYGDSRSTEALINIVLSSVDTLTTSDPVIREIPYYFESYTQGEQLNTFATDPTMLASYIITTLGGSMGRTLSGNSNTRGILRSVSIYDYSERCRKHLVSELAIKNDIPRQQLPDKNFITDDELIELILKVLA